MYHLGRRRSGSPDSPQQGSELATCARAAQSIGKKRKGNSERQAALQIKRVEREELPRRWFCVCFYAARRSRRRLRSSVRFVPAAKLCKSERHPPIKWSGAAA